MRRLTKREVEKRAVMKFISYFEEHMNMVILQSAKELEKRNSLNRVQGLRPRQRIDTKCVREAIKIINNNGHSSMPGRAGGKSKKEICEKHSQENTEVV